MAGRKKNNFNEPTLANGELTSRPESITQEWWLHPELIIIAAALSREDLPTPPEAVEDFNTPWEEGGQITLSRTPTTSMCRFILNASEAEITNQQNDMLRQLSGYNLPVWWAAYFGDAVDSDVIWRVKGRLHELYAHLESEIALKTRLADRQSSPPERPASDTASVAITPNPSQENAIDRSVELDKRERKIWEVITRGSKGLAYCRELDAAGVRPRRTGVWKDCETGTYSGAYQLGGAWRHRIQDEKSKIRRKAELASE